MASPLQEYNKQHQDRWTVLIDVPEWIRDSLCSAIANVYFDNYGDVRRNVVSRIERKMRLSLGSVTGMPFTSKTTFKRELREGFRTNSLETLLMLDVTVKYIRDYAPSDVPFSDRSVSDVDLLEYFEDILGDGSKWKVVDERGTDSGIIERVDAQLVTIAKEVDNEHLTEAWNLAFKLKPEPENAIIAAQNALEDIATSSGLTSLTTGIFGGIIGDIRTHPEKYTSAAKEAYELQDKLNKQKNRYNDEFAQWFKEGLNFIQLTNPSRHKSQAVKGFKLSAEAGQQAVIIASLLGWMIKSGSFKKVLKPQKQES